ncbi:bifunctional 5,10-methylenetetrahydrofolate dehydrogenase/5,10-methenyltetrahydrofolate cyclohydrolase [Megasphaera sp. DISK 18]|uniref:bifunctional 5,10-methylenetetrahydrofolate dehydrogenase/5,10-methenyltetrahydrofolate cyclohydrolase n=1 Tax=Megasphaera sp. DISK 18 TaxID=1776081 RepID=UPI0008070AA8|nr:bifunctional 5,10-methylenetetrahydrofolate dehydrogenase/5,10-methenyltetrahydrofolate cyclohydrolase [Megasphaera sp. DISK 18]OBZ34118.1 bifunctional 5,10-methylene-tetrahydrofolate dehydrogenase/5,10-methylene-tetrahydrofolate cyclohydrolase [Megasphaera sp. DISK 18]
MQLLKGKDVAAFHSHRMAQQIQAVREKMGIDPELAIVVVGDDAPSAMYAASMQRTARSVGLKASIYREAADISEADLLALIDRLNEDPMVFGILLMMPLPKSIDSQCIINRIDPSKDVDGLTDANIANLYTGRAGFVPCTPQAVMAILDYYHISLSGKEVVIVGRSNVVGKPLSQLCLQQNATVTVCHSRTNDLKAVCQRADVVIAAAGKAGLVTGDMIKPGAVVIDVGINRVDGKTVGDVAFDDAALRAGAITPVPGGVGAVTTMMILENVVCGIARIATIL